MVFLAVGVLVASIAFIVYYRFFERWPAVAVSSSASGVKQAIAAGDKAGGTNRDDDISKREKSEAHFTELNGTTQARKMDLSAPTFRMESEEEDASTPKATATFVPETPGMAIPELSLSNGGAASDEKSSGAKPASKPSSMAPPPTSASSLMPPPSVRPSALRPLPRANGSSSLMPPPSAASSLRVPPDRTPTQSSRNSTSTPASTSTLPVSARPRKKIILPPGHSPLDWAALTRNPPSSTFLRGEGVPPRMLKVSPKQLGYYHGRKGRDAWGTYQGKVYNMTPYKDFHPGGVGELMRGAGKAGMAEKLFNEIHPWVNWDGMLAECLVGVLVGEGEGEGEREGGGMDEMD